MVRQANLAAAGLALAASAILSFIDNFVLAVSEEAGLWQFQLFRTAFALPLLVLGGKVFGVRLSPVSLAPLALRSAVVSLGLLIYFAALGTLPVAQAGAGLFSAPLWVLLFSAVLFRLHIGVLQIVTVLVGFTGVLMLLRPDPSDLTALSLMPLAAGAFYGLGMLLTPYRCARESPVALALGIFVAMGLAAGALLAWFTILPAGDGFLTRGWAPVTPRFLWLTLFQAAGAVVAVSLIAQAYRVGAPALVAVFEYSFLVFASLWAFLLWGTRTDALAIAGIAVLVGAGTAMSVLQRRVR